MKENKLPEGKCQKISIRHNPYQPAKKPEKN